MITGLAVSVLRLHHHRRVAGRRAVNYDYAGALVVHRTTAFVARTWNLHPVPLARRIGRINKRAAVKNADSTELLYRQRPGDAQGPGIVVVDGASGDDTPVMV